MPVEPRTNKIVATASTRRGKLLIAHLIEVEPMTEQDLLLDMDEIRQMRSYSIAGCNIVPQLIVQALARGPLVADRYGCGICDAFGKWWYDEEANWDLESPLYRVFCYHEVPRLYCRFQDQQHYGRHANEIYERCIQTYRAAGWTGDAQEPNA